MLGMPAIITALGGWLVSMIADGMALLLRHSLEELLDVGEHSVDLGVQPKLHELTKKFTKALYMPKTTINASLQRFGLAATNRFQAVLNHAIGCQQLTIAYGVLKIEVC